MIRFCRSAFATALIGILPACSHDTLVTADLAHVTLVAGSKCAIPKIADLPVTISDGHILVPMQVNGSEQLFILDTGSFTTSVTPELADALRLPHVPQSTSSVGIGGATTTQDVRAKELAIGGFRFHNTDLATVSITQSPASSARAAGLIGAPFLSAFDIEVDLPHQRIGLYGSRHCAEGFLPWAQPYSTLGADTTSDGHIVVTAMLDGKPFSAVIDTGAPRSLLITSASQKLGLTIDDFAKDPQVRQPGAGRRSIVAHVHRFSRLSLGAEVFDHPLIEVGDARGFKAEMLIGLDFLATHPVWFGYGTKQVFIGPAVPGHVAAGKAE